MRDYYAILNLTPNASKRAIKNAYRKEAFKWHPDKNKSYEAIERMQLINEAYLILKDDEARLKYDKEYKRYQNFKKQHHSIKKASPASSSASKEQYTFDDDVLNNWIKNARKQAKEMVRMSIDDLIGMSKFAFRSAWDATKYYALTLVVLSFILLAIAK